MATVTTEQQAAHTRGPWSVCYDHPDPECRDSIAYIRPTNPVDGFWEANEIATVYACDGSDERRANARLLAAAPDMLDALRKIPQRYIDDMDAHTPGIANMIRAAIAKATEVRS